MLFKKHAFSCRHYLIEAIQKAILITDAEKQSESEFGTKYIVDFNLTFNHKSAIVRTGWIAENEDNIPRLVTCYIK